MSIKCHSSFVHYNMFHDKHSHCGGNNYGSIFNITNNCSGGHTGFWGGFGAGLGYGLGNLFGGFMGGMGNMFSGFGMNMFGGFGNMFGGFSMNMFSGFGNMFGGFGLNFGGWSNNLFSTQSYKDSDYYDKYEPRKKEPIKETSDDKEVEVEVEVKVKKEKDIAAENIKPEEDKKKNASLINGKAINILTLDDIAKLTKKDYKKLSDEEKEELRTQLANLITEDNDEIQKMLSNKRFPEELSRIILFKLSNPPVEPAPVEKTPVEKTPVVPTPLVNVTDDEILIGNNKIKLSELTPAKVKELTADNINSLTSEKATAILKQLGYVDNNNIGQMSSEYKVLLLLQKSGVNVQCAKNSESQDQWIQGKISNVTESDGKVAFTIDNGTADGDFKFKYSFKQVEDKKGKKCFNLTKIEKNNSEKTGYIINNWKVKDYIFQDEKLPMLTSGIPLISISPNNNRQKLETELS